jgi:hypothetical protein
MLAALLVLCPILAAAQTSLKATAAFVEGNAVQMDAKGVESILKVGSVVSQGDTVRLKDKTSRVVLKVSDGTELRLRGKTEMRFQQFNQSASGKTRKTKLELAWGSFWAKVAKLTTKSSRFEIKAGGVVCGVRGTVIGGWYNPDKDAGGYYNFQGVVYTDNGHGSHNLPEGYYQPFSGHDFGTQQPNTSDDSKKFNFGSGGGNGGENPVVSNLGGVPGGSADLLTDLTQDLGDAVTTTHNNDRSTAGTAQGNSNININLDTPESAGGTSGAVVTGGSAS